MFNKQDIYLFKELHKKLIVLTLSLLVITGAGLGISIPILLHNTSKHNPVPPPPPPPSTPSFTCAVSQNDLTVGDSSTSATLTVSGIESSDLSSLDIVYNNTGLTSTGFTSDTAIIKVGTATSGTKTIVVQCSGYSPINVDIVVTPAPTPPPSPAFIVIDTETPRTQNLQVYNDAGSPTIVIPTCINIASITNPDNVPYFVINSVIDCPIFIPSDSTAWLTCSPDGSIKATTTNAQDAYGIFIGRTSESTNTPGQINIYNSNITTRSQNGDSFGIYFNNDIDGTVDLLGSTISSSAISNSSNTSALKVSKISGELNLINDAIFSSSNDITTSCYFGDDISGSLTLYHNVITANAIADRAVSIGFLSEVTGSINIDSNVVSSVSMAGISSTIIFNNTLSSEFCSISNNIISSFAQTQFSFAIYFVLLSSGTLTLENNIISSQAEAQSSFGVFVEISLCDVNFIQNTFLSATPTTGGKISYGIFFDTIASGTVTSPDGPSNIFLWSGLTGLSISASGQSAPNFFNDSNNGAGYKTQVFIFASASWTDALGSQYDSYIDYPTSYIDTQPTYEGTILYDIIYDFDVTNPQSLDLISQFLYSLLHPWL